MSERTRRRVIGVTLVLIFAVPLAALALQAFADSWRAPSLLPTELGLRGFDVAFGSAGAGGAAANSIPDRTDGHRRLACWPAGPRPVSWRASVCAGTGRSRC